MAQPRSHPNLLAGPYLERATHWRRDRERIEAALRDPRTRFVPVWRSQSLVSIREGQFSARFVEAADARTHTASEFILLGEFEGQACFAVEIVDAEAPWSAPEAAFHDLRLIAGELSPEEAGLLAYARAMVYWRERHRFCGRCGARTHALEAGHVLQCSAAACGVQVFPRIDPAVIVLVTQGERVLLGRQSAWPAGRYSTIAGFVEPGESLEDAVIREVREETGVLVREVAYHSSQPWPFPSSLMLGFIAHAGDAEIAQRDDELEDVRWLTREQIAAGEVALPTTHSISFRLIEDWFDAGELRPLREQPHVRLWTSPVR